MRSRGPGARRRPGLELTRRCDRAALHRPGARRRPGRRARRITATTRCSPDLGLELRRRLSSPLPRTRRPPPRRRTGPRARRITAAIVCLGNDSVRGLGFCNLQSACTSAFTTIEIARLRRSDLTPDRGAILGRTTRALLDDSSRVGRVSSRVADSAASSTTKDAGESRRMQLDHQDARRPGAAAARCTAGPLEPT
jgi:hypothetical protein